MSDFLYQKLTNELGKRSIFSTEIPFSVAENLKMPIRPYQKVAFQYFISFYNEMFDEKPKKPYHLLFNMATGSGKTLVMAGLILYLYQKGYRNFLFFVNSTQIIQKTKENFLNNLSSKYLFLDKISVENKEIRIKEVENFEEADEENINIKFTTIQALHTDFTIQKENGVTFEDFQTQKIVLLADEAHHLSSSTKKENETLFQSWENTVLKIHQANFENILLEFTATIDFSNEEIKKKYTDKLLYKYDLAEFRKDKYSKEIHLIRSEYAETERILQALILNLYRQELAVSQNINLKPVILFKAKQTIVESQKNKQNFHNLIENLSAEMLENIRKTSTVEIVGKAFAFFEKMGISTEEMVRKTKNNFREENCLSANDDKEAEKNQLLLNSLEDSNNPIRAIFAVQKLNEGWDVLNLFDIVRLYEGQNTGGSNRTLGKTTIAEAQLIGRGARYFPFVSEEVQEKFKRKYDDDRQNDLRILEELYYHTREDSRYISELKKALIQTGIYEDEDDFELKELKLKTDFKKTEFYQNARVFFNKKVEKNNDNVRSINDLGVCNRNYQHRLSTGAGRVYSIFEDEILEVENAHNTLKFIDKKISEFPKNVVEFALSKNPFYHFNHLSKKLPNLLSLKNFIMEENYLGGLSITFSGSEERLKNITNEDYLSAIRGLLQEIEIEIKKENSIYEGSHFVSDYLYNIFKDKKLKINRNDERSKGQEDLVSNADWYVYNANYGTSEEKSFVQLIERKIENLEQKFEHIYLIRNEQDLKIYDKKGNAFAPDFVLFCRQKNEKPLTYQVFIEPKGEHLKALDSWKEAFLSEIADKNQILEIHSDHYKITGLPFYNSNEENEFVRAMEEVLE